MAEILAPAIDEAVTAWLAQKPDEVPTVKIRAAFRDLNCKQSGPEVFRRIRYPGSQCDQWPDAARLPAIGIRASERRVTEHCVVPIGTIVIEFSRAVSHGRRGKCEVTFGLVYRDETGEGKISWLSHRALRSRPAWEVTLPDGSTVEIARQERS